MATAIVAACVDSNVPPSTTASQSPAIVQQQRAPDGSPPGTALAPSDVPRPSAAPGAPGAITPPTPPIVPPTPRPEPAPIAVLDIGDVARTILADLRVRSKPRVTASSTMYTPLLPRGTELIVLGGPVQEPGYTWYQVMPVWTSRHDWPNDGWVAAASLDGEPWIRRADAGHQPLHGTGTPAIDGVLAPGEWADAVRVPFKMPVPPDGNGKEVSATLLVMNDRSNLYLAIEIPGTYSRTSTWFQFDNDADTAYIEDGHDSLVAAFYGGRPRAAGFYDEFVQTQHPDGGWDNHRDIESGNGFPPPGTEEGQAAGGETEGVTVVELAHPLASGDIAHDFQLAQGDIVGIQLEAYLLVEAGTEASRTETDVYLERFRIRRSDGPNYGFRVGRLDELRLRGS